MYVYRTSTETCERKIPYSARCVAANAATALSWVGLKLYPYQCDCCGDWHLTHYPQPRHPDPYPD